MGVCDPICLFYTILLKVLIDVTLCQGAAGLLNERYYFISSAVKQEFLLKWIVFYKSIDDLFTFKPLKMLNVWFNSNHFDCYSWEMLEDYLWWYTAPMPLYETDFRPLLAHIWLVWGNPSHLSITGAVMRYYIIRTFDVFFQKLQSSALFPLLVLFTTRLLNPTYAAGFLNTNHFKSLQITVSAQWLRWQK